jgi:hypothetical protein
VLLVKLTVWLALIKHQLLINNILIGQVSKPGRLLEKSA